MYPLAGWSSLRKGYRFKQRTWYTRYHLGLDLICPTGTPIYAPFTGQVVASGYTGAQGYHVHIKFSHDKTVHRYMHMVRHGRGLGHVNKGDVIGYVGSTGMSTGAHLHVDISNVVVYIYNINNFRDPETYNWAWEPINPPPAPPPPSGQFLVRVVQQANVRSAPRLSAPLAGSKTLSPGDTFTGVAVVVGDTVAGNNKWIKSAKGNYVWGGNLRY